MNSQEKDVRKAMAAHYDLAMLPIVRAINTKSSEDVDTVAETSLQALHIATGLVAVSLSIPKDVFMQHMATAYDAAGMIEKDSQDTTLH